MITHKSIELSDLPRGEALRAALRGLAQSVIIISARGVEPQAMSATALTPVSMDPPSLLVCVNSQTSIHPTLAAGRPFYVNLLDSRHLDLARNCAGALKGRDRFCSGEWREDVDGVPFLADAQASFRCDVDRHVPYGSHGIFIGLVTRVTGRGGIDPLIYLDGGYRQVGDPVASGAAA